MIKKELVIRAADILGDTDHGLSGSEIIKYSIYFAARYDVSIVHIAQPFKSSKSRMSINKRTALQENLQCFQPAQQFEIILFLCELEQFHNNNDVRQLKTWLIERCAHYYTGFEDNLKGDTSKFFEPYARAKQAYQQALDLNKRGDCEREVLDNLRLSLELLLHKIFNNEKPLEKQRDNIENLLKSTTIPCDLNNMVQKIINYFIEYHNKNVKHGLPSGNLNLQINIIFPLTTMLMKIFMSIKTIH